MCLQLGQFYKNIVLRLNEDGDVIETQTIRFVPPNVFSKLGPCREVVLTSDRRWKKEITRIGKANAVLR